MIATYLDDYRLYVYLPGQFDLTPYVIGDITGHWAMRDNKPLDRVGETGTITFQLNNVSKKFTPGHSLAQAGWAKGVKFILRFTFHGDNYIIEGVIGDIRMSTSVYKANIVTVTAVDWMEHAATHPIVNPGLQTNYRGDQVLNYVVTNMARSVLTDFDAGVSIFPTTLDTVTSKTKAMSEFAKVAFSEGGYVYLNHRAAGATLVFENRHRRHGWRALDRLLNPTDDSGRLLKTDGSYLLKTDGGKIVLAEPLDFEVNDTMVGTDTVYGQDVINHLTVQANPRRVDTSPVILFRLDAPFAINSGSTVELRGYYADPNGGAPCRGQNMIDPVATTDYLANTKSDGTGTNKTGALVITTGYGTEGFTHRIKNTDGGTVWVWKFNCRGYGIYNYNAVTHVEKDDNSIALYEEITETLDQAYQNTLYDGTVLAASIVDEEKKPRRVVKKINLTANRSKLLMLAFLSFGPGTYIHAVDNELEKNFNAYIQGVEFRIRPGGLIRYSWIVKEHRTLMLGLSPIVIEYSGVASSGKDAIDFGPLPDISELPQRTISLWVYAESQTFNNTGMVTWGPLYRFFIDSVSQDLNLSVMQTGGPAATAYWSAGGVVTFGQWLHVVLTHDVSRWPNDCTPIMYINGVSQVLTNPNAPGGTKDSEVASRFVIGNVYETLSEFTSTWKGKIKDVRVYDRVLSASEVTSLYNSGTQSYSILSGPDDGLLFQAFAVRTEELSQYADQTLTSALKVRDNIFGAIGTPNDSPIGRTA